MNSESVAKKILEYLGVPLDHPNFEQLKAKVIKIYESPGPRNWRSLKICIAVKLWPNRDRKNGLHKVLSVCDYLWRSQQNQLEKTDE